MTDRELMQQALETLEDIFGKNKVDVGIITALRQPLAQPEQWVGLTEAEKVNVAIDCGCADVAWMDFADAIEAKLRDKNT